MNTYLMIAAGLTLFLGIAHSCIGELLIFRHWRSGGTSKAAIGGQLPIRHRRILWASWHLASVLGWGFAAILYLLTKASLSQGVQNHIEVIICVSMFIGAVLVLAGTRGKHPGWIVLLMIAALTWAG